MRDVYVFKGILDDKSKDHFVVNFGVQRLMRSAIQAVKEVNWANELDKAKEAGYVVSKGDKIAVMLSKINGRYVLEILPDKNGIKVVIHKEYELLPELARKTNFSLKDFIHVSLVEGEYEDQKYTCKRARCNDAVVASLKTKKDLKEGENFEDFLGEFENFTIPIFDRIHGKNVYNVFRLTKDSFLLLGMYTPVVYYVRVLRLGKRSVRELISVDVTRDTHDFLETKTVKPLSSTLEIMEGGIEEVVETAFKRLSSMSDCIFKAFKNYLSIYYMSTFEHWWDTKASIGFSSKDAFKRKFDVESALYCFRMVTSREFGKKSPVEEAKWFHPMVGMAIVPEKDILSQRMAGVLADKMLNDSAFVLKNLASIVKGLGALATSMKGSFFAVEATEKLIETQSLVEFVQAYSFFIVDENREFRFFAFKKYLPGIHLEEFAPDEPYVGGDAELYSALDTMKGGFEESGSLLSPLQVLGIALEDLKEDVVSKIFEMLGYHFSLGMGVKFMQILIHLTLEAKMFAEQALKEVGTKSVQETLRSLVLRNPSLAREGLIVEGVDFKTLKQKATPLY